MTIRSAFCAALLLLLPAAAEILLRDDFAEISAWRASPSEGVRLELSSLAADPGRALRLDFDFAGRSGWAAARRPVSLDLPENWEMTFWVSGEAPVNDLEVKLIDPSDENVWWSVRRGFEVQRGWRRLRLKKRHFSFAWGPAGGGEIRRAAALELAITARDGGSGWVAFHDLAVRSIPPEKPYEATPLLTGSSSVPEGEPRRAMDGDPATAWRSGTSDPSPSLVIDFGEAREYGGLTIDWEEGRSAGRYDVETSDDGRTWTPARSVESGNGGRDDLSLPETESRFLRLLLRGQPEEGPGFGIREILVRPLAFSASPNAFFETIAREAPRGTYPRAFSGEQTYWTVVGADGDAEEGLLGEDGALEAGKGAFSVEPFLHVDGALTRWSDVAAGHRLEEGSLPIPSVLWKTGSFSLEITAFAFGPPGRSSLQARYRVRNLGRKRRRVRLFLAVRPFQVNPPAQFLNAPGGVSPIRRLEWDGAAVWVNGRVGVIPVTAPSAFGAAPFDSGPITDWLARGELPAKDSCKDPIGFASGALAFDLDLAPGAVKQVALELPLRRTEEPGGGGTRASARGGTPAETLVQRRLAAAVSQWKKKLGRVEIEAPPEADPLVATLRSNLAYILINRDGPAIQPGSRSYERSWIRDGALTSAALLRLGRPDVVRAFLEWFAGFQDPSGRVPCCVDSRGADPVVENDSHGELLYLAAEYFRFTRDRRTLERLFPAIERTVAYLDRLRGERRTPVYDSPGRLAFRGLLPESISHEGYSAKPMHSYWDDFWALAGLKDATRLAAALGRKEERARWARIRDEFAADLHASIRRVLETRGIDFIPGSVELADFDATSTTVALDPAGEFERLPRDPLLRTFERYFSEFQQRSRGGMDWDVYTPYETRTIGTFVRLGWRDRIPELLEFFLRTRRPPEWNQWSEGIAREPRKVHFVGDMPHTWVGSDFIRSLLDMFAYERETDSSLVLAAGIPESWVRGGRGIAIRRLRTRWGLLTYSLRPERGGLRLRVSTGVTIPPGGILLRAPGGLPAAVTVNGRKKPPAEEIVIRRLPADVFLRRTPG